MKCLFICKKGGYYQGDEDAPYAPSGLINSATYVSDMLNRLGIVSAVVQVTDNNAIDAAVTNFQPTHVFIEALWVVPSKFNILISLHQTVQWIIRLHSELPFLSNEGIAMQWIFGYVPYYPNVSIATNSIRMKTELDRLLPNDVWYLPNYYPVDWIYTETNPIVGNSINIGCFGAIRPLKNQFIQAVAVTRYADEEEIYLYYHINKDRVTHGGVPILKNIENLFANFDGGELIEHRWLSGDDYTNVLRTMNLGLQVSLSETFGLVSADMANSNIPLVVSPEIRWASEISKAHPTDVGDIVEKIKTVLDLRALNLNKDLLQHEVNKSEMIWKKFISHQ